MADAERYGQMKAVKIYNRKDALRQAIRREGTLAIQEAWDDLEALIDSPQFERKDRHSFP